MNKNKSWLYISILTLIVALTWVAVSAIGHIRETTVPKDVEQAASPLDPNLDTAFFARLQQKAQAK